MDTDKLIASLIHEYRIDEIEVRSLDKKYLTFYVYIEEFRVLSIVGTDNGWIEQDQVVERLLKSECNGNFRKFCELMADYTLIETTQFFNILNGCYTPQLIIYYLDRGEL